MDYNTISKEEQLKAIQNGARDGILHALGLDYSYMFDAKDQVAFRKEITDAIERGVRESGLAPTRKPCKICGLKPYFLAGEEYIASDSRVRLSEDGWTSIYAQAGANGEIFIVAVGDNETEYTPRFCPECGRRINKENAYVS